MTPGKTDWEAYFRHPFPFAPLLRHITSRRFAGLLRSCGAGKGMHFLELGGGNSCFYPYFRKVFQPESYTVADRCRYALEQLPPECRTLETDLLTASPEALPKGDVVFSAGLIEHFSPEETFRLIRLHLELTRPGGWTAFLFPTDVFPYRPTRCLAEWTGCWKFPDERPLSAAEVVQAMGQLPLKQCVFRHMFLTQCAVVFRSVSAD